MMLWPSPKLSFSQAPLCSLLQSSVGWGMQCPLPLTPAPTHLLCSLSHLWRRNILAISFCCFWPLHISIGKHEVVCVPFLGWGLVHNIASSKTPALRFQLGSATLSSPWPLLPPLGARTANSVLFTAAPFFPFLGISPEIFTSELASTLQLIWRCYCSCNVSFPICVRGWNLFIDAWGFFV